MYKLTNITANPYEDEEIELYEQQEETRIQELNLLFSNYSTIKLNYDNSNKFDIISPSIKYKNGTRVTWFSDGVVLGHRDMENNHVEILTSDYIYSDIIVTEII